MPDKFFKHVQISFTGSHIASLLCVLDKEMCSKNFEICSKKEYKQNIEEVYTILSYALEDILE